MRREPFAFLTVTFTMAIAALLAPLPLPAQEEMGAMPMDEQAAEPAASAPHRFQWLGADGQPLPFQSDEEIVAFLSTADVVEKESIPVGVTKPMKLTLSKGGVTAHAAFRNHHEEKQRVRLADGSMQMYFLDSYKNEVAAYELARMLGIRNLPPAALRKVDGQDGSVQLWLEGAMTYNDQLKKGMSPPGTTVAVRNQERADMVVFDGLINNIDRTQQNIMVDKNWDLWLIDHTRSFARSNTLPKPDAIERCSRPLYEAIKALDEKTVGERLGAYEGKFEIKALMKRRDKLVETIDKLIAKNGEEAVLFDYGAPAGVAVKMTEEGGGGSR